MSRLVADICRRQMDDSNDDFLTKLTHQVTENGNKMDELIKQVKSPENLQMKVEATDHLQSKQSELLIRPPDGTKVKQMSDFYQQLFTNTLTDNMSDVVFSAFYADKKENSRMILIDTDLLKIFS